MRNSKNNIQQGELVKQNATIDSGKKFELYDILNMKENIKKLEFVVLDLRERYSPNLYLQKI